MKHGEIEVIAPSGIRFKTPDVAYLPKASLEGLTPSFKNGELVRQFRLHAPNDPEHILRQQRFRLYRNGEVLDGITDDNGESPLLNSTELDTWSLEMLHDTDSPEGTA
ncbi:hypothetical protein CYR40_09740 [Chimaeribacter arupi]|uniref:hypothetical protein n=1 Tax=Chimaeribacter arupi TaxID=2060066 RepID=UPI000C7E846F|nr:hypothetical protein [Chimaeribacter arupi]PLR46965.1 hypothetical protein CYR40_09740 [Chimaeribacter arupi]PLR53809.1 hypothetical protein CYR52_04880 [Chimaeribacter arupi]